ncbi:terpenoid synthase [Auricularia subglabra TFB-10046 SS5]|nr:terpenoid synthase [Auricularia subglabra TFB-10046 SS5]
MTTPNIPVDSQLSKLCHERATSRGYLADGWMSIAPYLEAGVAIAQVGYAHLESLEARVWIAIWTGFLTALDDTYPDAPEDAVTFFVVRMLSGQKQPYPGLENFASHLREVAQHADELRAGIILTSTFNWVTSLQIDRVMLNKEIPPAAGRFPTWCSLLSGLCEGFAMFAFPPEVPFHVIAPAIPDMRIAIRNFNDIFSFYKEELAGDSVNQVSLQAKIREAPKLDVLDAITDEAIDAHRSICAALSGNVRAHKAWLAFAKGYAEFHFATKRYRLNELGVD